MNNIKYKRRKEVIQQNIFIGEKMVQLAKELHTKLHQRRFKTEQ